MSESLYQVLGIDPTATPDQIKQAFRTEAKRWHPDKNKNNAAVAEEKFKDVTAAYSVLSNPAARAEYDRKRNKKQMQAMSVEEILAAFVGRVQKYDCPGIDELAEACGA